MADTTTGGSVWDAIIELCAIERATWPEVRDRIRLSGHPTCEGEEGGEGGEEEGGEGEGGGTGGGEEEAAGGGSEDKTDWKRESRKHEARGKKTAKELEAAQAELAELRQAGASDQEKAIAQAREEAAKEAKAAAFAELRDDRLEVAVGRLSNGLKVKDGDETVTVKFADPDDALLHIQRAIKAGEVDEGDIFSDQGKVQTDALETALLEILERKPHLKATENGNGGTRVAGGADGGRGGGVKTPEDQTADEIFTSIQQTKA